MSGLDAPFDILMAQVSNGMAIAPSNLLISSNNIEHGPIAEKQRRRRKRRRKQGRELCQNARTEVEVKLKVRRSV